MIAASVNSSWAPRGPRSRRRPSRRMRLRCANLISMRLRSCRERSKASGPACDRATLPPASACGRIGALVSRGAGEKRSQEPKQFVCADRDQRDAKRNERVSDQSVAPFAQQRQTAGYTISLKASRRPVARNLGRATLADRQPSTPLGAFALAQRTSAVTCHSKVMAPFLYRCPTTGQLVQGWSAEEVPLGDDSYESVSCLACAQLHLVNRSTGRVLGVQDRE